MSRTRILAIAVTALVVVVFLTSLASVARGLSDRIEEGNSAREDLRSEVAETNAQLADQQAKTALAVEQLREAGIKPEVDASIPEPVPSTRAPSPAEMLNYARQALQAFCADGRCTPKPGEDGSDGSDGRGITSSQCTASGLIVTYTDGSSQNAGQCRGRDGTDGTDGEDAKEPRSIKSTECTDDGWVVTYTDGTTENAGRCRPSGPLG